MSSCSGQLFKRDAVQIVPFLPEHAEAVSKLHIERIQTGFISSLGLDFVVVLYRAIAACSNSFGYVAIQDNEVIGFIAFTTNLNKLYRSVLLKSGPKLIYLLIARNCSPAVFRNAFETFRYPTLFKPDLPKAEFLSMALDPKVCGHGLATCLLKTGFEECVNRGIPKIKTLSAVSITPVIEMYKYYRFQIAKQIKHHGVLSNIYVISTDHFLQKKYLDR